MNQIEPYQTKSTQNKPKFKDPNKFSREQSFVEKNLWLKNILGQKTYWSKKCLDPNKFKVQKVFGTKNVLFNKIGSEIFLNQNNLKFKKIFGSKLI